MLLKYFYDEQLAQATYMVGCVATGEALMVDPARNVQEYISAAQKEGLRITHITETHIHADFVSGSRELAHQTGGTMYLSDMGDENWKYGYADAPNVITVRDGDTFMVGNIRVQVMHTPGHTLEHIVFMVTDTAGADKPMGIFTGDFLFVGDIGRPDLLEEAAGWVGTKEIGARQQYGVVQQFKQLPDYLQIWPGHGAGSACGKALGAIPSTTLGYEKLFNPAFQIEDEDEFVAWLLADQPEPPRYFAQMKKVNKVGPALLGELSAPAEIGKPEIEAAVAAGHLVVDTRPRNEFEKEHIHGTVSIPATRAQFSTYVGWFVDFNTPLYLIVPTLADVERIVTSLRAIGVDDIAGVATAEIVTSGEPLPVLTAQELAERLPLNGLTIIDVRGRTEYAEQHIRGAKNIPLGYLPRHLAEIPRDSQVVLQCASGYRSQIATSLLRAHGLTNVANLKEGQEVWSQVLPVE